MSAARPTPSAPTTQPRWVTPVWAATAFVLTFALHTMAFPPFKVPEGAYVFAAAAVLWSVWKPGWKLFIGVIYGAMALSWIVLLHWLHHVTVFGMLALSLVVALFPALWFAGVRWTLPRIIPLGHGARIAALLGLAGAWVLLEWVRSWIFTGFPWLPLAASQWQRPVMLQAAAYGGAWAVSFALIFFNLGLAAYLRRLHVYVKERKGRFCPEFYLALGILFIASFALYRDSVGQVRDPLFKAGFLQPNIPQEVKWDPEKAAGIIEVLETNTHRLALLEPDVIFWPEAVFPVPLSADGRQRQGMERFSAAVGKPLVFGVVGFDTLRNENGELVTADWYNGVAYVDPAIGLMDDLYKKRHLVPFGEYIPLRAWLPNVEKFVPIGGDMQAGNSAALLSLHAGDRTTKIGTLICYEDVFPALARKSTKAGAQVLFVATNDAWYGETGAAYQHAAHSVLRAVETRRPVIRDGNAGWSGWIDEFGIIRGVLIGADKTVYFRGSGVFPIDRDRRWAGRESLYVRWGDWFVALSAGLVLLGWFAIRSAERRAQTPW
jgi:apolipoprotein N-acyltransferase